MSESHRPLKSEGAPLEEIRASVDIESTVYNANIFGQTLVKGLLSHDIQCFNCGKLEY